jgi:hypothetical protein
LLRVGDKLLTPTGKGTFNQKFLGIHFCQPLYQAMWSQRYAMTDMPATMQPENGNPRGAG